MRPELLLLIGVMFQTLQVFGNNIADRECKTTPHGTEYRGKVNKTISGKRCQRWNSLPKECCCNQMGVVQNISYKGPNLRENYCRNPDNSPDGPWCHISNNATLICNNYGNGKHIYWEYCDISYCSTTATTTTSIKTTKGINTGTTRESTTAVTTGTNAEATTGATTKTTTVATETTSVAIVTTSKDQIATSTATTTGANIGINTEATTGSTTAPLQQTPDVCYCPCSKVGNNMNKWHHLAGLNLTHTELKEALKDDLMKLKDELSVDKKETSAAIRRRTSAPDERKSSANMGTFAIIITCLPICFCICIDCSRCCCRDNKIRHKHEHY